MKYAILRFEKITTWQGLEKRAAHNERSVCPPNADPERRELNQQLAGNEKMPIGDRWRERAGKCKIRKNSVLGIEVICASTTEPPNLQGWVDDTQSWIEREFGGKANVISAVLHRDETGPHVHALIVPVTAQGGLAAKSYIGGRKRCVELQTSYHQAVARHGYSRGLMGSRRSHISQHQYYRAVERVQGMPEEQRLHLAAMSLLAEPNFLAARQTTEDPRRSMLDLDVLRSQTPHLGLPLIARGLGLFPRPHGRESLWESDSHSLRLGADGLHWEDLRLQYHGLGEVELVAHLLGASPETAIRWLARGQPDGLASAILGHYMRVSEVTEQQAIQQPLSPAEEVRILKSNNPADWDQVRNYLISLSVPSQILDQMHLLDRLTSSRWGSALGLHIDPWGDTEQPTGCSLCGRYPNGEQYCSTRGSIREGWFYCGEPLVASRIILVTGMMDALVYPRLSQDCVMALTDAQMPTLLLTRIRARSRDMPVVVATPADAAGDLVAQQLIEALGSGGGTSLSCTRHRPLGARRWADLAFLFGGHPVHHAIKNAHILWTYQSRHRQCRIEYCSNAKSRRASVATRNGLVKPTRGPITLALGYGTAPVRCGSSPGNPSNSSLSAPGTRRRR